MTFFSLTAGMSLISQIHHYVFISFKPFSIWHFAGSALKFRCCFMVYPSSHPICAGPQHLLPYILGKCRLIFVNKWFTLFSFMLLKMETIKNKNVKKKKKGSVIQGCYSESTFSLDEHWQHAVMPLLCNEL